MIIGGALKIPTGVTVNIYQAGNGLGDSVTPALKNCFLQINGATSTVAKEEAVITNTTHTPAPGIVVENGGTLKVFSGAIEGYAGWIPKDGVEAPEETEDANSQPGILVDAGGTVEVYGGELQGNGFPLEDSDPVGITVSPSGNNVKAGSLIANGGLVFSNSDGQLEGAPINGTVTYNGGTVWTSGSVPETGSGVWINTFNPSQNNENNDYVNITAFGNRSTYSTGVYSLATSGTFTIPATSSVTLNSGIYFIDGGQMNIQGAAIANNSTTGINFDSGPTGSTSSGKSTLTIGSTSNTNASLTIKPTANVTLGTTSILNNYGTITVEPPQSTTT